MKALALIAGCLLFLMPSLVSGKQRRGLELVLYFPFNEGKGKTTQDLSRFRNSGKLEGEWDWRKGKFGNALYLCRELSCGGEPGLVQTPQHEIFAFEEGEEITLMAWIHVDPAHVGLKLVPAGLHGRARLSITALEGLLDTACVSEKAGLDRQTDTQANYGLRTGWIVWIHPLFFIETRQIGTFIVSRGYGTRYH